MVSWTRTRWFEFFADFFFCPSLWWKFQIVCKILGVFGLNMVSRPRTWCFSWVFSPYISFSLRWNFEIVTWIWEFWFKWDGFLFANAMFLCWFWFSRVENRMKAVPLLFYDDVLNLIMFFRIEVLRRYFAVRLIANSSPEKPSYRLFLGIFYTSFHGKK